MNRDKFVFKKDMLTKEQLKKEYEIDTNLAKKRAKSIAMDGLDYGRVTDQGHQGDCGFRKLYPGEDNNFYVKSYFFKVNKRTGILDRVVQTFSKYASFDELEAAWNKGIELKKDETGLTMLMGEAATHAHQFEPEYVNAIEARDIETGNKVQRISLAIVSEMANLRHYDVKSLKHTKEHGGVTVLPGLYEFRTQVEKDINGELQRLAD